MEMPITATKYINILQAMGNIEDVIEEAIRSYAVKKIGEQISRFQREIMIFQKEYGYPYEKIYNYITTDEDFVKNLRKSHPTWERDMNTWEYYLEELKEWLGHLKSISEH